MQEKVKARLSDSSLLAPSGRGGEFRQPSHRLFLHVGPVKNNEMTAVFSSIFACKTLSAAVSVQQPSRPLRESRPRLSFKSSIADVLGTTGRRGGGGSLYQSVISTSPHGSLQTGDRKRRPGNGIEGAMVCTSLAACCALYSISWTTFHIPSL